MLENDLCNHFGFVVVAVSHIRIDYIGKKFVLKIQHTHIRDQIVIINLLQLIVQRVCDLSISPQHTRPTELHMGYFFMGQRQQNIEEGSTYTVRHSMPNVCSLLCFQ